MKSLGLFVFVFFTAQFSWAQNLLYLEKTGIKFEDKEQLRDLYQQYNQSILVVEDYIYLIPCECVACRKLSGDNEGRNLGGDGDNRNFSGDSSDRNSGGDIDGRNQGGESDERGFSGEGEGRNFAGESGNRNQGGESGERNQGGDSNKRNSGGDVDGRNADGEIEGRRAGGENDQRNSGAKADFRMNGGELSAFECYKKSRSKFILSGIHKNAEVYFYDGTNLIEVDLKEDFVKF
ncbi:hypothetical protein [Moheibacter lacus]|uniref:Uncharacterized protein n=1 Tax=Moheibacter lacus TaxID=2745851 RepID=A0A838ZJX1_9FLAO|nr:hypothetical protein [Moheibacter lacus]MBA5628664.1 hypothetical protein [Moheibacter lacus]